MEFRTEIKLEPSSWKIGLTDNIITVGSCFSESIGTRFKQNKFQVAVNPLGTTYHPLAIHKLLQYVLTGQSPPPGSYLQINEIFYHYDFHSDFSGTSQTTLKKKIDNSLDEVRQSLKKCQILMLTYGTAWIFERSDTGQPVANCHKVTASKFKKRLTPIDEIKESFKETFQGIKEIQPSIKIILTVSPVRHIRDTIPHNAVSKSILRVACHDLCRDFDEVDYFPAFEILMDDLRDYRYYKDDLIHPTDMAEDYIWDKFSAVYFNSPTVEFINQWKEINRMMNHRPFNADSPDHQEFLIQTLRKLVSISSQVNVEEEVNIVRNQLK